VDIVRGRSLKFGLPYNKFACKNTNSYQVMADRFHADKKAKDS
jgi:hypothetical protein